MAKEEKRTRRLRLGIRRKRCQRVSELEVEPPEMTSPVLLELEKNSSREKR